SAVFVEAVLDVIIDSDFIAVSYVVVCGGEPFDSCRVHLVSSVQQVLCPYQLGFSGTHRSFDRVLDCPVYKSKYVRSREFFGLFCNPRNVQITSWLPVKVERKDLLARRQIRRRNEDHPVKSSRTPQSQINSPRSIRRPNHQNRLLGSTQPIHLSKKSC